MASTEQWRGKPATCDQFPRCQHVRAIRSACTVGQCQVTPQVWADRNAGRFDSALPGRGATPDAAPRPGTLAQTSPGVVSPDPGPARPVGPDSPQGAPGWQYRADHPQLAGQTVSLPPL